MASGGRGREGEERHENDLLTKLVDLAHVLVSLLFHIFAGRYSEFKREGSGEKLMIGQIKNSAFNFLKDLWTPSPELL